MSDAANVTARWRLRLGWQLLWFVPLCFIVALIERHTVSYAFLLLKLGWHRWSWGALISPSAAFCLGVIAISIIWPVCSLAIVALLVTAKKQWRWVLLIVVGVLMLPLLTDLLIWGSFPFTFDNEGIARLRMIPFIPWPSGNYGEY